MRRLYASIFDRRGVIPFEIADSVRFFVHPSSFLGQRLLSSAHDLFGFLGLTAAHSHVPLRWPSSHRDVDDVELASILAGHGASRLILGYYPRQETSSTLGLGVVVGADGQSVTVAVRSREVIAHKRLRSPLAETLPTNDLRSLLQTLPGSVGASHAWDSHVELRSLFEPLYDRDSAVDGNRGVVVFHNGLCRVASTQDPPLPPVALPGSFNPLHIGHVRLLQCSVWRSADILGERISSNLSLCPGGGCELTIRNPDKPRIDRDELLDRMLQFAGRLDLCVSNSGLFCEKSVIFPNTTWVMGVDTADRLFLAKYYDGNADGPATTMRRVSDNRCKFIVAGRATYPSGLFKSASAMDVPAEWRHLFEVLDDDVFRMDISSSQLRAIGFSL
jgi:hypothetical protein